MRRHCIFLIAAACGAPAPVDSAPGGIVTTNAVVSNAVVSNAVVSNAVVSNAVVSNALTSNAVVSNALVAGALSSEVALPGGATEGALARQFITYVYSCAMPREARMELEIGGVDYGTLHGAVGLAPEWGQPGGRCDERCQRLVTACVLARTNFWGVPVEISLRGPSPALAPGAAERAEFPLREGAYWGNLFVNGGAEHLFACAGPGSNVPQLTRRFCSGAGGPCAIEVVYDCLSPFPPSPRPPVAALPARFACRRQDPDDGAVLDCYTDGVSIYADDPRGKHFTDVITVYLRQAVTVCGDGVCAAAETPDSCAADCTTGWARSVAGVRSFPAALGVVPGGDVALGLLAMATVDFGGGPLKVLPGEEALVVGRLGADGRSHRWSKEIFATAGWSAFLGTLPTDAGAALYVAMGHSDDVWLGRERLALLPGPQPEMPVMNTLLVKVSPDGTTLWRRRWPGEPHAFTLDAGDGPVVAVDGRLEMLRAADGETLRVVPLPTPDETGGGLYTPRVIDGANRALLAGDGGFAAGALWLDLATGAREPVDAPAGWTVAAATRAPDGGVLVAAELGQPDDGIAGGLLRYAPGGQLLWQKTLTSTVSAPQRTMTTGVAVSAKSGRIAVAGSFATPIDVENDVLVPQGYQPGRDAADVWVALYDAGGHKLWAKQMGGGGPDFAAAVVFTDDDDVVVSGAFSQTGLFDGRILDNPLGGGDTAAFQTFVVKLPGR